MATELARRGAKVIVNYANSIEAANKVVEASGKSWARNLRNTH